MSTYIDALILSGPEPQPESNQAEQAKNEITREQHEDATLEILVPGRIALGTLADPRLRVREPISVRIVADNGRIVAEAVGFDEFGFGANSSEAVHDLQHTMAELYLELQANADALGPDMADVWTRLQASVSARA